MMISYPGSKKGDAQKLFNDAVKDLNADDMIYISVDRKTDHDALIQALIKDGTII